MRRIGDHPVLLPPGERYLCADADGFNVHAHTSVGAEHKAGARTPVPLHPAPGAVRAAPVAAAVGRRDFHFEKNMVRRDAISGLHADGADRKACRFGSSAGPPSGHIPWRSFVGSQWRKLIVPDGQVDAGAVNTEPEDPAEPVVPPQEPETPAMRARRTAWAALMQRTFGLDVLKCEKCGGRMKLVAVVLDPYEVARLCDNLGEPTQAPKVAPSRFVVQTEWDFAGGSPPPQGPTSKADNQASVPGDQFADPPVPPEWDEFADSPIPPTWDDFADSPVPPAWDDFADPPAPS